LTCQLRSRWHRGTPAHLQETARRLLGNAAREGHDGEAEWPGVGQQRVCQRERRAGANDVQLPQRVVRDSDVRDDYCGVPLHLRRPDA
jgi:hypothetical protein